MSLRVSNELFEAWSELNCPGTLVIRSSLSPLSKTRSIPAVQIEKERALKGVELVEVAVTIRVAVGRGHGEATELGTRLQSRCIREGDGVEPQGADPRFLGEAVVVPRVALVGGDQVGLPADPVGGDGVGLVEPAHRPGQDVDARPVAVARVETVSHEQVILEAEGP